MKFLLHMLLATTTLHSQTVAKMGAMELPAAEVSAIFDYMDADGQPLPSSSPEALDRFVRSFLVQRFVLDQAAAADHEKDPQFIIALKRAKEAAMIESYLRKVSAPGEGYPSNAEISEAYEKNKAALLVPKAWHIAQIYIAGPEKSEEALKRLSEVQKQLEKSPADFAAIATASSNDGASAPKGGDLGWLQDSLIQPAIKEAAAGLKVNGISKPVRLAEGWHIIRLLGSQEASTPSLEKVTPQIRLHLRKEKARIAREEYLADIIRKNPIAVNGIELQKLITKP